MFMDTFKIEIMPITEDGTPIVRVNGKKVPMTPEEPFRQFVNTGVRDIEVFNIMMYGSKPIYKIISDIFGIRTTYDGKGIFIQVRERAPRSVITTLINNKNYPFLLP